MTIEERIGKLEQGVASIKERFAKMNTCHNKSDGQFCSTGGGGGGWKASGPDSTGKTPVPREVADTGASLAESLRTLDRKLEDASYATRSAGKGKRGAKAQAAVAEAEANYKKASIEYHDASTKAADWKQKHGLSVVDAWEASKGRPWPHYRVDSRADRSPTHYVKD